jgi:hypothetical protein
MEGDLMRRLFLSLLLIAGTCVGQKYSGPEPEKPDLPYLLHATSLVATEAGNAQEEQKKDVSIFWVNGASSPVKTPLAEPIFLLKSEKLVPERLTLFKMEVKNGRREVSINTKKAKDSAKPVPLSVKRLGQGLYRLEANDMVGPGEYCLSPEGANEVFCFQVY